MTQEERLVKFAATIKRSSSPTPEDRLDTIESDSTKLRRTLRLTLSGVCIALLSTTYFAVQGFSTQRTIVARQFSLVDSRGNNLAILGPATNGVIFSLNDPHGKPRFTFEVTTKGSMLSLYDADNRPRAALVATTDGSALFLLDTNENSDVEVKANNVADAASGVFLRGPNNKPAAGLFVKKGEPSFLMANTNGTSLVRIEVAEGKPMFFLQSGTEGPAIAMNTFSNAATLLLSGVRQKGKIMLLSGPELGIVQMWDPNDRERISILVSADNAVFQLNDSNQVSRARLSDLMGSGMLQLLDADGTEHLSPP